MKAKVRKTDDRNRDASTVDLKLAILSELAAAIQLEVDLLGEYVKAHSVALKNTFDIRSGINLAQELRNLEIKIITHALNCTRGHQVDAARLLGLKPTTLNSKIKHFGIPVFNLKSPRRETLTNGKDDPVSLASHQITREPVADNGRRAI